MTVLAGVAGAGSPEALERHCRCGIAVEQLFAAGGSPEIQVSPTVVFGSGGRGLARASRWTDPDLSLVADVRLDNRSELARGLGLTQSQLADLADPDLLLVAWSKWGVLALEHFVGVFAFALHDRSRGAVVLVRDPFGERPLNYSVRGGRLSFASMPGGVWPDEALSPDLAFLAKEFQNWHVPLEQSRFQGIKRVAPGTLVEFMDGSCQTIRYWNPQPTRLPSNRTELIDAFRHVMDESVAARLSGPSLPISTTLSSGFDSSCVTGTAARLLDHPELLTAYTSAPAASEHLLVPSGRFADESPTAAHTATMLGVNHCIVRDGSPILSRMRGLSHYFQAPVPNPLNFGWARAMLDDVRSSGQSVLLTATEGNFTISFGGMLALPALLRGGRLLRWIRETRDMVRTHAHLRWRGALYASFEPFLPIACLRALQAAFNRREYLSEFDFVNPALDSGPPPLPGRLSGNLLRDRVYLLSFHDNGERFKGMTALTGVEERDPTNDRRLVEFCLSMEPEHLLHRGEPRPLAREAFADRMNPRVFDASTRGLQSADWFARMSQSEARDILDEIRATSAADVIDIPKLEGAINRWPEFKPNAFAELFPFGRGVSQALNVGLFVAETERHGGRG